MSAENEANEGWVPDEALAGLRMERQVRSDESDEEVARRIFLENLPVAALAIVHLAQHSGTERVRLDASKYVVERNLGKIGEDPDAGGALERMIEVALAHNDSVAQPPGREQ
jgi:hypothetical protein